MTNRVIPSPNGLVDDITGEFKGVRTADRDYLLPNYALDASDVTGLVGPGGTVIAIGSTAALNLRSAVPGRQYATSGVPKDVSGVGNDLVVKAGITDAQLWANAGYFSAIAASDGYPYLPNAAFPFTMGTDSILMGVLVNDAVPGGQTSMLGCANTTTRPGFYWAARPTTGAGRVVVTTTGTGAASVQGADTACAFYDSTPHHLVIGIDGPTRSVFVWRDGLLVQTQLNLFPTGAGLCSSNFAFGTNQDTGVAGTSVAAKFAGFQLMRFLGAGLPTNVGLLVQRMAASPYNPIRSADVVA